MRKGLHIPGILVFTILALPFIYLAYIYPALPPLTSSYFGLASRSGSFIPKSSLWLITAVTAIVSLLLYYLMRALPEISRRKAARYSIASFNKAAVAIVIFLSLINFFFVASAQSTGITMAQSIPVLIGILFAFIGNVLPTIRPYYFVGVRTPWTLKSEATWRKTHQLAGGLCFAGGILIIAFGLFLPASVAFYPVFIILFAMLFTPAFYSSQYYKTFQKNKPRINQKLF